MPGKSILAGFLSASLSLMTAQLQPGHVADAFSGFCTVRTARHVRGGIRAATAHVFHPRFHPVCGCIRPRTLRPPRGRTCETGIRPFHNEFFGATVDPFVHVLLVCASSCALQTRETSRSNEQQGLTYMSMCCC